MRYCNKQLQCCTLGTLLTTTLLLGASSELPADWPERSSYGYDKRYYAQWLFHLDFLLDHSNEKGNIDKVDDIFNANIMLRYGHWSLGGKYAYMQEELQAHQSKDDPGTKVTANEFKLDTFMRYDFNAKLFASAGHSFSRKEEIILYDRHMLYAGAGTYLLHTKKHVWEFFLAGVKNKLDFQSGQNNIGWTDALMLLQNYHYVYNDKISLDLFAYYMLDEVGDYNEYQCNLSLNLGIIKHIALVPHFSLTHYNFMSLTNQYEDETRYGIKLKIDF